MTASAIWGAAASFDIDLDLGEVEVFGNEGFETENSITV